MPNGTKDRILEAALAIFSRDGYAGTNLKDIAESVGVVKSAFYRHYASKKEVWDAVLDRMECYYTERFGSTENLPPVPKSTEELKTLTLRMLDFTVHDEKIIKTRRILLTEQFRDERARKLATRHFNEELESIFTKIFAGMMENGSLRCGDPAMLAFAYTAPISAMVQLCDREPERYPEVMEKIRAFVEHFILTYGNADNGSRHCADIM